MNIIKKMSLLIFLLPQLGLIAQSDWESHVDLGTANEVVVDGNKTYIANRGGLLVIDTETKEEKLFHPGNSKIEEINIQDLALQENGNLWVNTGKLYNFNGENFVKSCDSIDRISDLLVIAETLWFTSYNTQGIYSLENDNLTIHTDVFPYGVRSIQKDNENNLWVIYHSDLSSGKPILATYKNSKLNDHYDVAFNFYYNSIHFIDSESTHWIYQSDIFTDFPTFETNLQIISSDTIKTYAFHNPTLSITGFYESPSGHICAYNNDGIGRFINDTIIIENITTLHPELPEDARVTYGQDNGELWIQSGHSTNTLSMYHLRQDKINEYWFNPSFRGSTILDLSQDCEGKFMSLNSHHVNKMESNSWTIIPMVSDNSECVFEKFLKNPFHCETWLTSGETACTSIWSEDNDMLTEFPVIPTGYKPSFFSEDGNLFCTISSDVIWIDKVGAVTKILLPSNTSFIRMAEAISSNETAVMAYDTDARRYKIYILQGENWEVLDPGPLENRLEPWIYSDTIGQFWVGYGNDLIRYNNLEKTTYLFDEQEVPSNINDIHIDKYGNYWLATQAGIIRWDQENTSLFNTSNSGLTSNLCTDLEIIEGDNLWINHHSGVTHMKIDSHYVIPQEDPNGLRYSLYPNPSSGLITLTNPTRSKRFINIFTMSGAFVSSHISDEAIWSTTLETGVYLIRILEGGNTNGIEAVEKIVVFD